MKFVCRKCESFMLFSEVEGVSEGSLGVTFGCPQCGARVSMVTNPGETQMVRALGVQLGGRKGDAAPLELTRQTLAGPAPHPDPLPTNGGTSYADAPGEAAGASSSAPDAKGAVKAAPEEGPKGKCPFADMLVGMPGFEAAGSAAGGPGQAAPSAAAEAGPQLPWTPEAKERLERVPAFVREMARLMIEQMARERGLERVDGVLMDAAKERFM